MKLSLIRNLGLVLGGLLLAPSLARAQTAPPPGTTEEEDNKDKDKKKKSTTTTEESNTPSTGAAGSTTGTAAGTTSATGPTVTLGTSPTKDTPQKSDKEKKPEAKRLFWADSQMFVQQSLGTTAFAPSQQLTRVIPSETFILLMPRFTINKDWQVRVRAAFTFEWTDTAQTGTTTKNEPQFGDTLTSLWYRGIPAIPGIGVKITPNIGLGVPTSKASWARTMIVSPSVGLQFSKAIEKFAGGDFMMLVSPVFSHPFYRNTTPEMLTPLPYSPSCYTTTGSSGDCSTQVSGLANPENTLSILALISQTWGKWNPAILWWVTNVWGYTFKDLPGVARLEDRTNFRQSSYFAAWLDYNINPWLTGEVGYYMIRNMIDGNGRIANPIFDTQQDMRVYLGFNVGLDKLYQALTGAGGDAGIVRAENKHAPIMRY